ncbi:hypothetical protein RintRC_4809 [Richelia intracellularis]|nr:hypothetical protein RintRC_4809 [Richelia intracellularis]
MQRLIYQWFQTLIHPALMQRHYFLGMNSKQLVDLFNQTHFINNSCHYA